jgi:protein TonB
MRYTSFRAAVLLLMLSAGTMRASAQRAGITKPEQNADAAQRNISATRDTLVIAPDHNQANSSPVYRFVEQMPAFPGDLPAFLSQHLKYPDSAMAHGIEGRVVIEFIVRKDGSLTDAKVIRSVDKTLDLEALRMISIMPRWKPGMQNGKAVDVWYVLPFMFKLD